MPLDVDSASDKEASVVEFHPPEQLEKLVDFSLPENAGGVEGNEREKSTHC